MNEEKTTAASIKTRLQRRCKSNSAASLGQLSVASSFQSTTSSRYYLAFNQQPPNKSVNKTIMRHQVSLAPVARCNGRCSADNGRCAPRHQRPTAKREARTSLAMLTPRMSSILSHTLFLMVVAVFYFRQVAGVSPSQITSDASSQLATAAKQAAHLQATFATPNHSINITHLTYDPLYDTLYVGATNTIYQLNATDLSVQHEQSTGPVLDNPSCGISECPGFEEYMKPTQDINKVLVIDYQHRKLLSCGSTKQGACRRYQLNNIAQKEDLIPMAVAANDDNSSTYAFIAPARYTYDHPSSSLTPLPTANGLHQQQVLYVASTYTKVGQSRELLVPAIGTRTLDEGPNLLKLYENSFLDNARIDINSHLRDYFLVNYLYGFASSNYIYFVTVQKKATSRDLEELGYHTRLARICITDSSYNSYTEVDLKCAPNKRKSPVQSNTPKHANYFANLQQSNNQHQPSEYPLLQDAILVDAGSQLLQSLAQSDQSGLNSFPHLSPSSGSSPDEGKVLLGVFSSAKDHTQYAGDHSAICAFSLAQIEDKFNDNIHNCYTGKMQSRNMEYIAGNVQECPKSGQGGNVVNFCHETLKINGTIPIVSKASAQFFNTTLTAITATSHIDSQAKNIYSEQLASDLANDSTGTSSSSETLSSSINSARQHTVVFAGTANGHIKKILLNNASNGIEFDDVQVDPTGPILADLHLHASGRQLFAATPYKVIKVATHNCAQYATCRECSQSRNPYCGWCSLRKSCTTKSECGVQQQPQEPLGANSIVAAAASGQNGRQQFKWISSTGSASKCIDLQSILPDKIPMTSTGKVDLLIERLPRLPKEHSYKCVFNRTEQTTATPTQLGLSCPLPRLIDRQRHVQIEPGRDHAIVDLAVRSSETNTDFLNGKITFFDCQRHTTCKDCLTTNWGCNWCLNENVCLFNTSKCERTSQSAGPPARQDSALVQLLGGASLQKPVLVQQQRGSTVITTGGPIIQRNGNTISQVQQCPTFDVGHQQDILIADGSEKELSIRVKNMPQFKGAIKCVVSIESYEISLAARIQEDRVVCENSTYSYVADVGLLNGQLKVIYSDNNILVDRTNFTLYKCHLLGAYLNRPDCSLCQRIDVRFQCAWCAGQCQFRSRCSERPDSTCPAPRIDFVHPLSGPTLGGTRVTIEGSNLGQSFEEIANRVTIGNVPCKPIEEEYRPSNRIVCLTSAVVPTPRAANNYPIGGGGATGLQTNQQLIPGDIVVGNRAGYSIGPNKFQFKSIHLRDHQPRYGPQSGGTRLTLSGVNLNIGSTIQVFLDELPCLIEYQFLTSEQLVCKTTASKSASRLIKSLRLIIDDANLVRDDNVFYYAQDPIVSRVTPLRAYLSGGRPINVFGANLTAVQLPRMVLHDLASGKTINETVCIIQDDTRMQCPSPAVNLQLMDLEFNEQHLGSQYEAAAAAPQQQQTSTWVPLLGQSQQPARQLNQLLQQDESVKFGVSFVFDNVIQSNSNFNEITYSNDPKLFPFASDQFKVAERDDQIYGTGSAAQQTTGQPNYQLEPDTYLLQPGYPTLVLFGEHLQSTVGEYDTTITVGQDLCNLTHIAQNKLVCAMPLDRMATPTDEEGHQTQRALPLVVVRIGFNLRFELGYVQYHPLLVEQIIKLIEGSSGNNAPPPTASSWPYQNYVPQETNDTVLNKVLSFVRAILLVLAYASFSLILLALTYSTLQFGLRMRQRSYSKNEYKRIQAKVDSMEKSIKNECRIASLALQGDLNELVRHVDLSGVPLLDAKQYIMKVFFPGISQHPLLLNPSDQFNQLNTIQQTTEGPFKHFERLLYTKQFLIAFVNALERQPRFTLRDKVNVASLLMIVLMERLDYATDVMKTLLFQLVERYVNQSAAEQTATATAAATATKQSNYTFDEDEQTFELRGSKLSPTSSRFGGLSKRACSNLLNGLPISKRQTATTAASRSAAVAANLGKAVGGSASSLMASTGVAAQMLLARAVGANSKTSPTTTCDDYLQHSVAGNNISVIDCTTTFNQRTSHNMGGANWSATGGSYNRSKRKHLANGVAAANTLCVARRRHSLKRRQPRQRRRTNGSNQTTMHLMLRRTDSIVEKMLTNWLALNMYDYFQGQVGQSLYMLFEALRSQLERGPIDCVSGDAYYSLNETKLLREPRIQFELVNLYVIVDTNVLQLGGGNCSLVSDSSNLLLDSSALSATAYGQRQSSGTQASGQQSYAANTITLALRVLDCDTINQVKAKILAALYRNSGRSTRLGVDEVELSLRQQQQQQQQQQSQYVSVVLVDEDYSSVVATSPSPHYNCLRRINTLRHYGVVDQAIMMLRRRPSAAATMAANNCGGGHAHLADMLDDHYNNPYAEIQYVSSGNSGAPNMPAVQHVQPQLPQAANKSWHLSRRALVDSPPNDSTSSVSSRHSPSMLLLSGGGAPGTGSGPNHHQHSQLARTVVEQLPYYQSSSVSSSSSASSSSASSAGNVMDTHSTSANSSSIINSTALLPGTRLALAEQQQPIYYQIGSTRQSDNLGNGSSYYCQINNVGGNKDYNSAETMQRRKKLALDLEQEKNIYLTRMLTSKGTIQQYIDEFVKTILDAGQEHRQLQIQQQQLQHIYEDANFGNLLCGQNLESAANRRLSGACPPAVKWLFDLLDEAAIKNGISDPSVIHAWKSNAFLLRFWVNFTKNPNYILDVEKTPTLDASLSVIAQTLMDACTPSDNYKFENQESVCNNNNNGTANKLLFARDLPIYRNLVKGFYQDVATMRPVSDQEIVRQMNLISMTNASKFDTNLALKELCVYAVSYGVEIMNELKSDYVCQQMDLSQQLEHCFRSLAYSN